MTELTLQIQYAAHALRPTCARFIPDGDTVTWLDELTSWGVPLDALRLYPLPRSRVDNSCVAVLVVLPNTGMENAGTSLAVIDRARTAERLTNPPCPPFVRGGDLACGHAVPYGRVAGRLFLPVEAALSVELLESEWRELLESGTTEYVWHPHAGLVAFDPDEVLTVADLLSPQSPDEVASHGESQWGFAQTGVIFPNRIVSLRAELPPSAAEVLALGQDGIGTQARDFDRHPATITDKVNSWGQTLAGVLLLPFGVITSLLSRLFSSKSRETPAPAVQTGAPWLPAFPGILTLLVAVCVLSVLIRGSLVELLVGILIVIILLPLLQKLLSGLPPMPTSMGTGALARSPAAPGPVSTAIQQQLARFTRWTAGLLDSRRREIDRLKKLLDEDPDEGLKYALPMGGEASRGIAPPSGWLAQRMVDFRLGSLGGGSAADYWDLPADTQFELIKKYRELAAREVQLGRYRRAAYIYAALLADLNLAATTLVNGKFYREAAVLYRDKLKRPLDAAMCLEKGGLLLEAIPIYRELGLIETVGNLYRRLEDHEQAELAYREAVGNALSKSDHLEAARILRSQLEAPDEALATLDAGWPQTMQARRCLEASFDMLAGLGRHEEVQRRIHALRRAPLPPQRVLDAVEVLSHNAVKSPHAASRTVAADTVRVLAAGALTLGQLNRKQLTEAVRRLAPEDKLLSRDCARAAEPVAVKRKAADDAKSRALIRKSSGGIQLIKTYQLPKDVIWTAACETVRNFYVVGRRDREIVLAKGAWNDPMLTVSTVTWGRFYREDSHIVMCHSAAERNLWMGSTGTWKIEPREFPATDTDPDREVALAPSWMPNPVSAIAATPNGTVYTFHLAQLQLLGFTNSQLATFYGTLDPSVLNLTLDYDGSIPMVANDLGVYLAIGNSLCEFCASASPRVTELPDPILGLALSAPRTGHRLAVCHSIGGSIYWDATDRSQSSPFGHNLHDPRAIFLRDGRLVAQGRGGWQVYETHGDQLKILVDRPGDLEPDTIAMLRPGNPNQVALCTTDGQVLVYEL